MYTAKSSIAAADGVYVGREGISRHVIHPFLLEYFSLSTKRIKCNVKFIYVNWRTHDHQNINRMKRMGFISTPKTEIMRILSISFIGM